METEIKYLKSRVVKFGFVSSLSILMATLILTSCNNTKPIQKKELAEKFVNSKQEDANFLISAAEINLEEIQLAQLAQANSMNVEVINLGMTMETKNAKTLSDLNKLAEKKQINILTPLADKGQDENNPLIDKQGADFDKEYFIKIVKGQKEAINKFEKASVNANDVEIRNWAISMLPSLHEHLKFSISFQKQLEQI